jgi:phage baseplate assembly protein W
MEYSPQKAFLGVGCAFPLHIDPATGDFALAVYEEDIHQAIRLILDTNPGERVMLPDFGAGLRALVFEPVNTTTMALVRQRGESALVTWEPRIDLKEVKVTNNRAEASRLNIEISYLVRATNTFYNLVYPFYLQEGRA